ncbi:hypothetical protein BKA67DRAFT_17686 [Truncatella angustata]|uniref:Uncharacterized protein n=1 Tax=Truncatella angustata TaxID=152316 RepID=A0A9P8UWZ9_9PEZI|nr:uncharacterized protein BKA67DRAFT_17686 [Truncatella angustata]KAH6659556.1 hypothetical protein BKA67DRAFT_17686 [Truncatella angustata]
MREKPCFQALVLWVTTRVAGWRRLLRQRESFACIVVSHLGTWLCEIERVVDKSWCVICQRDGYGKITRERSWSRPSQVGRRGLMTECGRKVWGRGLCLYSQWSEGEMMEALTRTTNEERRCGQEIGLLGRQHG